MGAAVSVPGMPGLIFGAVLSAFESFATVFRPRAQRVSATVIAVLIAAVTIGRPIILDKEYRVLDTDEQEECAAMPCSGRSNGCRRTRS